MTPFQATISHGQIIPDAPVELPDGTRVTVVPSKEPMKSNQREKLGMREEDWPTTPEGIAALLRRWDQQEPLEMTPEEEAKWEEIRQSEKEWEKARFNEDARALTEDVGMKRCLLDTGIAGDYLYRRHGVYERAKEEAKQGNRIGICGPVLGELWYGVEFSSSRDKNAKHLRRWLPDLVVWPFDIPAAEEFGRLAAELRRIGRPIGKIDIQVAAIALSMGNTIVVSADSDLAAVPGLTVENWRV